MYDSTGIGIGSGIMHLDGILDRSMKAALRDCEEFTKKRLSRLSLVMAEEIFDGAQILPKFF